MINLKTIIIIFSFLSINTFASSESGKYFGIIGFAYEKADKIKSKMIKRVNSPSSDILKYDHTKWDPGYILGFGKEFETNNKLIPHFAISLLGSTANAEHEGKLVSSENYNGNDYQDFELKATTNLVMIGGELISKKFTQYNFFGKILIGAGLNFYEGKFKSFYDHTPPTNPAEPIKTHNNGETFAYKYGFGIGSYISETITLNFEAERIHQGTIKLGKEPRCSNCSTLQKQLNINEKAFEFNLNLVKFFS